MITSPLVQLLEIAPYFLVADLAAAAAHYRDALGFEIGEPHGMPPSVVVVSRDGLAIVLREAEPGELEPRRPRPGRADAYVWVHDLDGLAAELRERAADVTLPDDMVPSADEREMQVRDLDGHVICFGRRLG